MSEIVEEITNRIESTLDFTLESTIPARTTSTAETTGAPPSGKETATVFSTGAKVVDTTAKPRKIDPLMKHALRAQELRAQELRAQELKEWEANEKAEKRAEKKAAKEAVKEAAKEAQKLLEALSSESSTESETSNESSNDSSDDTASAKVEVKDGAKVQTKADSEKALPVLGQTRATTKVSNQKLGKSHRPVVLANEPFACPGCYNCNWTGYATDNPEGCKDYA